MPKTAPSPRKPSAGEQPAPGRLDLNLLEVFDVVMTERHVTRAAVRLGMTQSAVSNALNRLRRRFNDQLFIKAARGIEPTPRAVALWPRLHQAMEELRDTVEPIAFEPGRTSAVFRIAMADITAALVTPHLYREVHADAPGMKLHFVPNDRTETGPRLMRGELDFAFVIEPQRASVVQTMPLWSDRLVVAARREHPLLEGSLSLAAFCSAPQVAVNETGNEEASTLVEQTLAERELTRNVCISVNQYMAVPGILRNSNLIAVVPSRFAAAPHAREDIAFRPLPFRVPDVTVYLSTHQRSNASPGSLWLKQRLLAAAAAVSVETDEYLASITKAVRY